MIYDKVIKEINATHINDNKDQDHNQEQETTKKINISIHDLSFESGICGFCEKNLQRINVLNKNGLNVNFVTNGIIWFVVV